MSFLKGSAVGRLATEPEVRYTPSGSTTLSFRFAADGRKKGENTTFFRVTAWDRLADRLISLQEKGHLSKGSQLYIDGQLETRKYTDRNGNEASSLEMTMSDFQFVGGGQQQQQGQQQYAPQDDYSDVSF